MFVSDDAPLVRDFNLNDRIIIEDDTLTGQAGLQFGVDGPVNEVLFLVRNLLKKFIPAFDIDVASTAGTYTTTIVVEVDVMFLRQLQNGQVSRRVGNGNGCDALIFKCKFYGSHSLKTAQK